MKPLSMIPVCVALLACQPTISPQFAAHTLVGAWRVEQIQATNQLAAFFSRTNFHPQTQPDLLAVTLIFQTDGRCAIITTTGQQTGTWQAGQHIGDIEIQLASRYRLTGIQRQGDVLTFQSADLTSFLGIATYTLRRQATL